MNPFPRHRLRLLADLVRRDLLTRYAGSYLGMFWALVVPVFTSIIYILVFGVLMKGGLLGPLYAKFDFTTFYFLGFAPWLVFQEVAGRAPFLLRENRSLIRNLRFDHQLLPLMAFGSSAVAHVVVVGLCLALIGGHGYAIGNLAFLPLYFAMLFLLAVGTGYLLAALSVFLPDLAQAVPIALNLLFFACPILYTPQLVADSGSRWAQVLLIDVNPLAHLIEGYRFSLLALNQGFDARGFAILAAFSLGVFVLGVAVYRRLQKGFADVL